MSTTSLEAHVSSKPWHLTHLNLAEVNEVFIWKNGCRMKLKDGTSSGPVRTVAIKNEMDKVITLKGHVSDGSQRFAFHCQLAKFETTANDFCKTLAPYLSDITQFGKQLCEVTCGAITLEPPSQPPLAQAQGQKRKLTEGQEQPAPEKKKCEGFREKRDRLQEEIPGHQIGVFNLPVCLLREPPQYLRVREVKDWYVNYLMEMILDEETDHEDLTAPLLVMASVTKQEFKSKNLSSYTYEVIGGIQRWNAICKINAMNGRKIINRKCAVYDKQLTRAAALDLARQHNEYNSIQRTTTFPEVAACCRRLLFSHFADKGVSDDGTTNIDVPRYNKTAYRVFKQECLTFLLSSQTSQAMIDQAIQMALLPASIYHKMQSVFVMYEKGELQGQKPRCMEGVTLQKALEGKLAAKLQQFKVFQGLDNHDKEGLLNDLISGSISFGEAEGKSEKMKSILLAKSALLKEVEIDTWEEAEEAIPEFAKEDVLRRFELQRGKPLPKSFKTMCERAKAAKGSSEHSQINPVMENGCISVLAANPGKLSCLNFEGCELLLLNMKDVSSNGEVEDLVTAISSFIRDCTVVVYNIHANSDATEIETMCGASGATYHRLVLVSSVMRCEGNVLLGTSQQMVISWWGPGLMPKEHLLAQEEIDSIMCHPEDEDTIISTLQSTGWMKIFLNLYPKLVFDVYSVSGEMTQLCLDEGISCHSIHASEELAWSFVKSLGLGVNTLEETRDGVGADDSGVAVDVSDEGDVGLGLETLKDVSNEGSVKGTSAGCGVANKVGIANGEVGIKTKKVLKDVSNERSVKGAGCGVANANGEVGMTLRRSSRRTSGTGVRENSYVNMSTQSLVEVLSEAGK